LNSWQLSIEYAPSDSLLSAEVRPALAIPDNQQAGISSGLTIAGSGVVKAIEVQVAITHTYIGDLQIELHSPAGNSALLRGTDWRREQNLDAVYNLETTPTLQSLVGDQAVGSWTLRVRDLAGYDTGTLDRWSLALTTSVGEGISQAEAAEMSS
ncbi:MAG: proprotein convertase P-domain-containing protein, partial [Gammaproteobacteria bacterium]|nr:proprotein convertase P-domain-containing protein [Gammaproteobacteria bacterium]